MNLSPDTKLVVKIASVYLLIFVVFNVIVELFDQYDESSRLAECGKVIHYPPHITQKIPWNHGGLLTFWFDGASDSQYRVAFPVLEAAGYPAVVSVPVNSICKSNHLTWNHLGSLQAHGWDMAIQLEPLHCDQSLTDPIEQLDAELVEKRKLLGAKGLATHLMITPCGGNDDNLKKTARLYFDFLRTQYSGVELLPLDDPYNLHVLVVNGHTRLADIEEWFSYARMKRAWLIVQVTSLDDTHSDAVSVETLKAMIALIKKNELQVVLPNWFKSSAAAQ